MPTPVGSDLYVSRPLTNLSIAYFQSQLDFVADKVFPSVPIDKQAGIYYTYDKGDWLRTNAQKRAPRTESAGTGWNVGQDTFFADVNAIHVDVADQDRANTDKPAFDLDRDATNLVARDILLRRELDWLNAYWGTGKWSTTDQVGVASGPSANQFVRWNKSSSTPIEDIEEQRILFSERTGLPPNFLVLGPRVYSAFKNNSEFIERIKYSERAILTKEIIAAMLDIDNVYVPMAVQNTADEGAAENITFIHGDDALLGYAAASPGLMQPSAGYVFEWTGYLGAAVRGTRTSKFRMEHLKADRIETESAYQFKRVSGDLAVFFSEAVDPAA